MQTLPPENADPTTRLRTIVARLRAPDGGCPWDQEQTHASLRGALIEETYETLAAIDSGDDANLCEELGDLLLHVVMHAQMAAERGAFTFDDVARGVGEKMVRRHPHVFGSESAADSAPVLGRWEEIKRQKKGCPAPGTPPPGALDGVPDALPALMRAQKVGQKAARVGFDWKTVGDVLAKVREEVAEVESELAAGDDAALADELGDLLYAVVNLARWRKLEAELLLRQATDKFAARFRRMETVLRARGQAWESASFEELDALWEEIKHTVHTPAGASPASERNGPGPV